jgi:ribonuclease HI
MENITIFADGASKGNPGPGGWGALVASGDTVRELGGREAHTTNNKMELRAALEALTFAQTLPAENISVHTDSSYVINGITKWVHGWKKNGWMTKDKKEVSNQELWKALDDAVESLKTKITWTYVGGHVGVAGNERVDAIASNFAENKKTELYNGSRANYAIDIENLGHDDELHKAKSASKSHSKAKAYSYVSKVDNVIKVHKTWAECESRVRGKKARFKKALSAENEAEIIKEFAAKS